MKEKKKKRRRERKKGERRGERRGKRRGKRRVKEEVKEKNQFTEKNIYVIVGCFSSEKNAKNLVSQLKKKGYNEACLAGRSSNRNLYRVACSKYENLKEANKKLKDLKKEFQGAWVLNRN